MLQNACIIQALGGNVRVDLSGKKHVILYILHKYSFLWWKEIDYNSRVKGGDSNANILQTSLQGVCCHDLQYKINETSMCTHSLEYVNDTHTFQNHTTLPIILTIWESMTEECVYVYTYDIYSQLHATVLPHPLTNSHYTVWNWDKIWVGYTAAQRSCSPAPN